MYVRCFGDIFRQNNYEPVYKDHLSIMATLVRSLGWPLYGGLNVCVYIYI